MAHSYVDLRPDFLDAKGGKNIARYKVNSSAFVLWGACDHNWNQVAFQRAAMGNLSIPELCREPCRASGLRLT